MNKYLKWFLIGLAALLAILLVVIMVIQSQTKKYSPEQTTTLSVGDVTISVFYNRPYKKDREIFGHLVPYGEVWRTGANEATIFSSNVDLKIDGKLLEAGKYTLWTIPEEEEWTVIFNKKQYGWGVGMDQKASRLPEYDALMVHVPVQEIKDTIEQFTITLEEGTPLYMNLIWDQTKVAVPMSECINCP